MTKVALRGPPRAGVRLVPGSPEAGDRPGHVKGSGLPGVGSDPAHTYNHIEEARPNEVATLQQKEYRMDITPPPWFKFDEAADVEPTDDGFAVIQDGHRIDLSDLLLNRMALRVFAAHRREDRADRSAS